MPTQKITYKGEVIDERDVNGNPAVFYDGKVIGDVLVDKPRTLQTENKVAKTNIVIGSAVLACEGKALTSDILVETVNLIPVLEDISWAEVSAISKAGLAPQYWKIGDVKPFTMNGHTYNAQIVAFDHFDVADYSSYGRSKAGIVFQFKECIPITKTRKDALNYANEVATSLLECKDYIPIITYLQGAGYNHGGSYYQQAKGICPSEIEIVGSIVNGRHREGTLLAYYAAGNSKVKHTATSASPVEWWTRTFTFTQNQYVVINTSGQGVEAADAGKYCAPVFCI